MNDNEHDREFTGWDYVLAIFIALFILATVMLILPA